MRTRLVPALIFWVTVVATPTLASVEIVAEAGVWPAVAENQSPEASPELIRASTKNRDVTPNEKQGCQIGPCYGTECEGWTYSANRICRVDNAGLKVCVADDNYRTCVWKELGGSLITCQTCIN